MSMEAFEQLQMLQPMTDGAIKYMLDNQLQPTIENLYMAQFSGSAGYTGQTVEDMEQLSGQIQNMLSSMGLPVNENTMAGLPVADPKRCSPHGRESDLL